MTSALAQQALPDITKLVEEATANRYEVWPHRSNWASHIGHPCLRHLVYWRLYPERATIPPVKSMFKRMLGTVFEPLVRTDLEMIGVAITKKQKNIAPDLKYNLSGRPDWIGELEIDGKIVEFPVDAKTAADHVLETVTNYESLKNSNMFWLHNQAAQMVVYCYLTAFPTGLLYYIGLPSAERKHVWVPLDLELAEECLQKAETIEEYVKAQELPDRIPYHRQACAWCEFNTVCGPDVTTAPGILFETDEELEAACLRYEELKPLTKEADKVWDSIKAHRETVGQDVSVGDFLITKKSKCVKVERIIPLVK